MSDESPPNPPKKEDEEEAKREDDGSVHEIEKVQEELASVDLSAESPSCSSGGAIKKTIKPSSEGKKSPVPKETELVVESPSSSSGGAKKKTTKKSQSVKLPTLKEVIAQKRREMRPRLEDIPLTDPFANAAASCKITRGKTYVIYDGDHKYHKCNWDENHPESPSRAISVIERIEDLLRYCIKMKNCVRNDLEERIKSVHSEELYQKLRDTQNPQHNMSDYEAMASNYDSVYFNATTYNAARRAVSATLNLVEAVAEKGQNGMAIVRPPGHHAMANEFNGYCFFNNVAIAAKTCLDRNLAKKILIVDFDVHHGQGTQQIFYNRKDVLYFSIHRYEHGTFWPNLLESNFNFIGIKGGVGYNINVPLNAIGLTDDDYMAIVLSLLIPVAYEYGPDLVIVSAGYDAAVGCPEGRMNVTPGFYSHIISLLSTVAKGRVAVVLEGGYFLPTLAEGAYMTLKALLGGPCPILEPIRNIHPCVIEVISNVRRMLMNRWNCFQHCTTLALNDIRGLPDEHKFLITYFGEPLCAPYPTRDCYPEMSAEDKAYFRKLTTALKEKYQARMFLSVVYVYEEVMLLHKPKEGEFERPERPDRLSAIKNMFAEISLDKRLKRIRIQAHNIEKYSPHESDHISKFESFESETNDIYVNHMTETAALTAVNGLLTVVDSVMTGKSSAGVAVIRPPGHHAEHNRAMGFCFLNNVAIAANYLREEYQINRILIVDFDVHHGNGTQNIFYNTHEVMYISIHRDDRGKFFPCTSHKNYTDDGHGPGRGFNINIPFNKDKMGDSEYLAAFQNIVLPAAYSFAPKVILVSAGFDAGIYDLLGGYEVHPETFGHFIHMLKPLAEGKLILALEGGYNSATTSFALSMCAKALLGDPIVMPNDIYTGPYSNEARKTIISVIEHLKQYHNIFKVNQKLSLLPLLTKKIDKFTADCYKAPLLKELDIERVEYSEYVKEEIRRFQNDERI